MSTLFILHGFCPELVALLSVETGVVGVIWGRAEGWASKEEEVAEDPENSDVFFLFFSSSKICVSRFGLKGAMTCFISSGMVEETEM